MLAIAHDAIRRGRRLVLEAVRFEVPAPVAIAVVGVNGSGKSSLFMQLTDTLRTSRGRAHITLAGGRPSLAYVPQVPTLPPWLHVEGVAAAFGLHWPALVSDLPQLLLHEIAGRRVSQLSLGQCQALSIAVALGRTADLTVFDEPFSALDFRRRVGAQQLLRAHVAAGRCLMLSSQSAADLADLCSHFLVIRDGRYIFNGALTRLVATPSVAALEQRLLELLV